MKLGETFAALRQRDELAFMGYQTAGFPTLDQSLQNLRRLDALGADLLEVGVPFSDPVADGPTIQYSSQVALQNGVTLRQTLEALAALELAAPIVLMSYLNPLLACERADLCERLRAARVAGLIIPYLPADEADDWLAAAREHGIALVFLLAPTSSERMIRAVAERTDGFIYAVALTGTTGSREQLSDRLPTFLGRIRAATDKPLVVGFGISRPEHVRALRGHADGVVVASRIIDAIRKGEDWSPLVADLKEATKS